MDAEQWLAAFTGLSMGPVRVLLLQGSWALHYFAAKGINKFGSFTDIEKFFKFYG